MVNHRLFLWIGGALIVMPFLGIPESWKHILMFMIALALIAIALVLRSEDRIPTTDDALYVETDASHPVGQEVFEAPEPSFAEEEHVDATFVHEPLHEFTALEETFSDEMTSDDQLVSDVVIPNEVIAEEKPKKPRKKRTVKKPTVQEEMNEPVVVSSDILDEQ